jgi:hypothetical protein
MSCLFESEQLMECFLACYLFGEVFWPPKEAFDQQTLFERQACLRGNNSNLLCSES